MNQYTPITEVKGIGEKTARLFSKLSILTVGDLLTYYPKEYEMFDEPKQIAHVTPGEFCSVKGFFQRVISEKKIRNLHLLTVSIQDGTGSLQLVYFNMPYLKKTLRPGACYIYRGLVQSRGNQLIMEQPKMFSAAAYYDRMNILQPKYSLTKGLTNTFLQKVVQQSLQQYCFASEYFPEHFLKKYQLISRREALGQIHFPVDHTDMLKARKRIVFDEFFFFLFFMQQNKLFQARLMNSHQIFETAETVRFLQKLPYQLTRAQQKVWGEIRNDLGSPYCMNRLVQGDVGSGKTIVAMLALLMCASNGLQGALMAPTEVLAMQHFETIVADTQTYGLCFRPVLLVGSMTAKEKRQVYEKIRTGEANLIIGTQALIQEKVQYQDLGLVVTDEQHRFGVRQRESLAQKGKVPHVLVMSATPIPRTLAIILYGDLHISVIDELPSNRLAIKNCVIPTSDRPKAYRFMVAQVEQGHQVYVVCPMVDEGELEGVENVLEYTQKLAAVLPASIRIASLHGKMKPLEKNRIMEAFAAREIDILVSTTVIEVGINVPNATVMMVENADRFGLAQLHQLRGRVGRGASQSYCIFIRSLEKKESMERLEILNQSNDGFYIASKDLALRGPGDLFGIRQSGAFAFALGDIYSDSAILTLASNAVEEVLHEDPDLKSESYRSLQEYLAQAKDKIVDFRTI